MSEKPQRNCPSSALRPMKAMGLSEGALAIVMIGMVVSRIETGSYFILGTFVVLAFIYEKFVSNRPRSEGVQRVSITQNKYVLALFPNWHKVMSQSWVNSGLPPSPKYKSRYEP